MDVRKKQVESRSKSTGKRKIQPVLMTVDGEQHQQVPSGNAAASAPSSLEQRMNGLDATNLQASVRRKSDTVGAAERAASHAEGVNAKARRANSGGSEGNGYST